MTSAQLAHSVYLTDPDTNATVNLAPGTCPEPRLAALVTNPSAWVDGKMPRQARKATETDGAQSPTGDGRDDASGDDSASSDADTQAAEAAPKTATKRAASRSRGRDAADEGTSGK